MEPDYKKGGCSPEILREHEKRITENEQSSARANKRMDNLQVFIETMHDMNTNIKVIAEQLKTVMATLLRHEESIDKIEDTILSRMETKEAVTELVVRVQELEEHKRDAEASAALKKVEEYEDMKKHIGMALGGVAILVIGSLVIFAIVILTSMANAGALPTP